MSDTPISLLRIVLEQVETECKCPCPYDSAGLCLHCRIVAVLECKHPKPGAFCYDGDIVLWCPICGAIQPGNGQPWFAVGEPQQSILQ